MDIKEIIKNSIITALAEIGIENLEIELEIPPDEKMGDIALPCFGLSKILRGRDATCLRRQVNRVSTTAAEKKRSPNEIAKELAERVKRGMGERGKKGNMGKIGKNVEKIEAQGGYVNFFYKRDVFLNNVLRDVLEKGDEYGKMSDSAEKNPPQSPFTKGGRKRIMVEYSGPNTNKPLHLGHGRNSFLGMAVSNLLENAGAEVIKANIINDRGAHICKSMLMYKMFGNGDTPKKSGLKGDHFVGKYYAMFSEKLKENPALEEEVKEMLRKWEAGDKEVMMLWKKMNSWYYEGVEETYKKIGSEFDKYYYESETYKHGRDIVLDALEKKIVYRHTLNAPAGLSAQAGCDQGVVVYKKEDGAIAIDLSNEGLDEKILLRSDGTSVYITQDLYTAKIRFEEFNLDKLIYVVADEQNYHFKVLFKILEKLGYEWAKNCYHLSYGMVNLPSGKLKSREGTKVDLDDLVEKLKQMAMAEISKKQKNNILECEECKKDSSTHGKPHPRPLLKGEGDVEERAMRIGLAALKFMLLKVNPSKTVMFNPEEAISFEGDTGPYVLYGYTRIKSIFKKMSGDFPLYQRPARCIGGGMLVRRFGGKGDFSVSITGELDNMSEEGLALGKPHSSPLLKGEGVIVVSDEEMKLAKLIYEFPEILEKATEEYNPSLLANYLLNLAGAFNQFYHIHYVLDAETKELREMRLVLIQAVAIVIKRGMGILGIEMVEEM